MYKTCITYTLPHAGGLDEHVADGLTLLLHRVELHLVLCADGLVKEHPLPALVAVIAVVAVAADNEVADLVVAVVVGDVDHALVEGVADVAPGLLLVGDGRCCAVCMQRKRGSRSCKYLKGVPPH